MEEIRTAGARQSKDCTNLVRFLAYSGVRIGDPPAIFGQWARSAFDKKSWLCLLASVLVRVVTVGSANEKLPEPNHGKGIEPAIGAELALDLDFSLVAGIGVNGLAERLHG